MKKIQIVTSYSLINEPVIRNRLVPYITVLANKGYFVSLISPDIKVFNIKDVEFEHLISPDLSFKPRNFIKRFYFEFIQSNRLITIALKSGHCERLITIPSMFLLFMSFRLPNCSFHVDIRDLTWEYISGSNLINRISKSIFRALAKYNLKRSKSINVTNESELLYLKAQGFRVDDIKVITNGVGKNQFECLSKVKKTDSIRKSVTYIGNVGLAQHLDNLVNIAYRFPDIDFTIVGAGTDFKRISELALSKKCPNVFLKGRVDWKDVINFYNEADILYAQISSDFSSAVPSKLYEYLSTGKYILYGGDNQARSLLKEFDNNMVIPPCDESALYEAIQHIIENNLYQKISKLNKLIIKDKYVRENSVVSFLDSLE